MEYWVHITSVPIKDAAKVDHLAALLAKLPNFSIGEARNCLLHPPFDLPSFSKETEAEKLLSGLQKLGLTGSVRASHSHTHVQPVNRIELREETPVKEKQGNFHESRILWIGLILIALFFALLFYFKTTPPQVKHKEPAMQEIPVQERVMERKKKESKARYQKALHQLSLSTKLLREAERTPDAQKSANLMLEALQHNPFNEVAWQALADKYRRVGDEVSARKCETRKRESESIRQTLQGIAEKAKLQSRVELNVAQIQFNGTDPSLDRIAFHKQSAELFKQVNELHPEKEFEIRSAGTTKLVIKVLPGEDFPDLTNF